MKYNMKFFILMSSFLLFAFSAVAEFNRKEKRPEYFIPEKEIAKTPVFVGEPLQRRKSSPDTVAHISAKYNNVPAKKTINNAIQYMDTAENKIVSGQNNKDKTPPVGMEFPRFQKVYDEYHQDILVMKKRGYLPVNQKLKEDLDKMSGDERFLVTD